MAVQATFLNFDPGEGYWKIIIFYIFALALTFYLFRHLIRIYSEYKTDIAFGRRHGCQLPPELHKRWPLGIDRIKELWESNAEGRLLAFLCTVAKDYEPHNNLTQSLLFGPRTFYILHPQNIEAVLSTSFKDYGFGARRSVFFPLLGNGIFTQEGLAWKHSRELVRKQLIHIQYRTTNLFREHVDNLIAHLPTQGDIDLQPLFFSLTLDTTTALLFGKSVYSLRADIDQAIENKIFSECFDLAQDGLAKRFRIAPWHFFYNPPDFRQACHNVHQFVERYIKELDLSYIQPKKEASFSFINQIAKDSACMEDLRDQLLNILLAGRDTTACCLSWTLRLLVRHEVVMTRLQREIDSVMGDSKNPRREQIRKMPYLACVIRESLRLYPPVPLNNRQAIKTTILPTGGGPEGNSPILVRKGEQVVFSQYVNSRKQNIYGPDADGFRPERWEGPELANARWAYFPFNGGPRQCVGENFALMGISYTIVRLVKALFITLPTHDRNDPIGSERQRLTLVLSSADGCRVTVKCRESTSGDLKV